MISRYKHICGKILQTYNLSILSHKKLEKLTTTITKKDTESVIKNFPTKKVQGPDMFTDKFYQIHLKKLLAISKKYLQKKCSLSWQLGLKIEEEKKCFQTQSMKPPSV